MANQSGLFPIREPITDPATGLLNPRWQVYFRDQANTINSNPQNVVPPIQLTGKSAAITTTSIPTAALAAGLYRVSTFQRVTTAASVSSSLTTTIGFTCGGVACTVAGAAMTGNTTATVQTNSWLLSIDASTPITYAVAYSSSAAGMVFQFSLTLEVVNA